MDLSIVIPALNESKKIASDILAAGEFLNNNFSSGQLIIADDGSGDNTSQVARNAAASLPATVTLEVMRSETNRGKGFAVRTGIARTTGEFVAFADSGLCIPYESILDGLALLKNGCDIAYGSRKLPGSKIIRPQSYYRRLCSAAFHLFLVYGMKIPAGFTDTQCGFKIYRGQIARKLYSQCITDGFMFDIEILLRAQKAGCVIKEFPVEWTCDRDSRLSPARSFRNIFSELRIIRRAVFG